MRRKQANANSILGLQGQIGWLGRRREIPWRLQYPHFDALIRMESFLGVKVLQA